MRNLVLILLCAAVGMIVAVCDRAPSKGQVIGSYSGTLNGASESISLNEDGTFSQRLTLPSVETLTATGTWTLRHKAVDLKGYLHFYDEAKNGTLAKPKLFSLTCVWGAGMLIRDWDSGCYTLKHK